MEFRLTKKDWKQAEEFLTGKQDGTKFEKSSWDPMTGMKVPNAQGRKHSFIIVDDVIYAISNRKYTEPVPGTDAIVKKGMTKAGEVVAIKIQFGVLKDRQSDAMQAAIKDKLFISQGLRQQPGMTITVGSKKASESSLLKGNQKLYSVMEWRGDTIFDLVLNKNLPLKTRYLLALKACLRVRDLHQEGTLHCDIKAENLAATVDGDKVTIKLLDMDFAIKFPLDENCVIGEKCQGTSGFISPEILFKKRYSPLSDTFSLAVMCLLQLNIAAQDDIILLYRDYSYKVESAFKMRTCLNIISWLEESYLDLDIEPTLYNILKNMLAFDYQRRCNADAMILYLCDKLKNDESLDPDVQAEIQEIDFMIRLKIIAEAPVVSIEPTHVVKHSALICRFSDQLIKPKPVKQPTEIEQKYHSEKHSFIERRI